METGSDYTTGTGYPNGPGYTNKLKKEPWTKKKKFCCCCGVTSVIVLIIVVILIILAFTVFKAKNPSVDVDSITLQDLSVGLHGLSPSVTMTLATTISVHNPNIASLKYKNSTAYIYYHGTNVGNAPIAAGKIAARKTTQLETSINVELTSFLSNSNLTYDLYRGIIPLTNTVLIKGTVDVAGIFKLHNAKASTYCKLDVNISSASLQNFDCNYKVKLI